MDSQMKNIAKKIHLIKNSGNLKQIYFETTTSYKETDISINLVSQNTNSTFSKKVMRIIQSYDITLIDGFKINYLVLGILLTIFNLILIFIFSDLFEFLMIVFYYFFQTTYQYFLIKLIKLKRRVRHHRFYVRLILVKTLLEEILKYPYIDSQA
jgi:hypothetical protein